MKKTPTLLLLTSVSLIALTACSQRGTAYYIEFGSGEYLSTDVSDIENRSYEEWSITDDGEDKILCYVEPEPNTPVPPGMGSYPSLLIGDEDKKINSASFEFMGNASFTLYNKSSYFLDDDDQRTYFYYSVNSDGTVSLHTSDIWGGDSYNLKDSDGEEIIIEDYNPNEWSKVTLENVMNRLIITVNDTRIKTEYRLDGTEQGRLAVEGEKLKNIVLWYE